jgi:hypothetical protein
MLSGGEVARLQQSSQCVSGVSDTFSYANAVRHAMALKMSRSVRDMGHSRTHTQPLAIKDTQRPSLRCVARAPNGHSGPLHSSMTLPVTLVNKHQPLRLASRATSPFNALGNKNPSITLESIPHLETQSHSYVHVVGFLSHHFNTHTHTHHLVLVLVLVLVHPFPAPARKATEVLHAAPILFFFVVTVSRTLLSPSAFFGRSVPLVHRLLKDLSARTTNHASESHALLTGALVCQRDAASITGPCLGREAKKRILTAYLA